MLTRPPLQNDLTGVLLHFREGKFAFCADIEAMFSRIRLRPEYTKFRRFLWSNAGLDIQEVYQMNRVTFGDTLSPCIAIRTVHCTAEEYGGGKSVVVRAIKENIYVDDYMNIAASLEETLKLCCDVKNILAEGDFHLRKWMSNVKTLFEKHALVEICTIGQTAPVSEIGSEQQHTSTSCLL